MRTKKAQISLCSNKSRSFSVYAYILKQPRILLEGKTDFYGPVNTVKVKSVNLLTFFLKKLGLVNG